MTLLPCRIDLVMAARVAGRNGLISLEEMQAQLDYLGPGANYVALPDLRREFRQLPGGAAVYALAVRELAAVEGEEEPPAS